MPQQRMQKHSPEIQEIYANFLKWFDITEKQIASNLFKQLNYIFAVQFIYIILSK